MGPGSLSQDALEQQSFAKNFTQFDVIFAEEETKPSDDEEPDCE